jgi:hypothetical protein
MEIKTSAIKIFEESQYRVLPARVLFPENFQYPSSSIEGKKQLLVSMTPMLTEGENQRKMDATKCEEFTRCRVEKDKLRSSHYQYIDVDTNQPISGTDYHQRLLCSFSTLTFVDIFSLSKVQR